MQIVVITNNETENIFIEIEKIHSVTYIKQINLLQSKYDIVFDFLYEATAKRNEILNSFAKIVFINYVSGILTNATKNFVRFNGWNSLCEKTPLEISCFSNNEISLLSVLKNLNLEFIVVPNTIGMVTPKIISMIVNEAYFALGDAVSTKAEIDIAMQLGTNYPYGPFAWSEKIGLLNIYNLLLALSKNNDRYKIASLLTKEIN